MDAVDTDEDLLAAARGGGSDDDLAAYLHALRDELTRPGTPEQRWNHVAAVRRAATHPMVEESVETTSAVDGARRQFPVLVDGQRPGR